MLVQHVFVIREYVKKEKNKCVRMLKIYCLKNGKALLSYTHISLKFMSSQQINVYLSLYAAAFVCNSSIFSPARKYPF